MASRLDRISNWKELAEQADYKVVALAVHCRVTERHLARYFRLKFGCSPHSWLNANRIEAARILLAQDTPVKEVASAVGYKQQSSFSRQFRLSQHVGLYHNLWVILC